MPRARASSRAKAAAKAAAEEVEEPQQPEEYEDESMEQVEGESDGPAGGQEQGEEAEEVEAEEQKGVGAEAEDADEALDTTMGDDPEVTMDDLPPLPEDLDGSVSNLSGNAPLPTMRKDRTLQEFLGMMDEYGPIIPDAVAEYYLSTAGFECKDVRLKRLLALAAQKFVADIATDAYQYSRVRSGGSAGAGGGSGPGARRAGAKAVLTMEDLRGAMGEIGGELRRPEFYR